VNAEKKMNEILSKILNAATGGLGGTIIDLVKEYFPPDMDPVKKAELQIAIERVAIEREREANAAAAAAEQAINERIASYEGTASDLKALPVLGAVMLFLRGAQRPLIGYATMYMDLQVFSGAWKITDPQQTSAFWIINVLVLGFLFGERAVKNVAPMLAELIPARRSEKLP
jgi:hypothetical protein